MAVKRAFHPCVFEDLVREFKFSTEFSGWEFKGWEDLIDEATVNHLWLQAALLHETGNFPVIQKAPEQLAIEDGLIKAEVIEEGSWTYEREPEEPITESWDSLIPGYKEFDESETSKT